MARPLLPGALAAALLAAALYSHPTMLNGELVYDDGGTVQQNPVTQCEVPWVEIWRRDYWGKDQLTNPMSHKSFRPITSITLVSWGSRSARPHCSRGHPRAPLGQCRSSHPSAGRRRTQPAAAAAAG